MAAFGQGLTAEQAIFPNRHIRQNAAMGKDEYRNAIAKLPRGAKAELARRLGKPGYFVSKMFGRNRKLRHDEVVIIDKLLDEYREGKMARPDSHQNVTVALKESRPVDADDVQTVRLWTIQQNSDGGGGHMSIAETTDSIGAPADLKQPQLSFSIEVWDDSNSPQLPRGATLFITRSTGRDGQWHVFGKPIKSQKAVQNASLGVLMAKLPQSWRVRIGTEDVDLPFAEYPAAWQVRQIHY